jgi:hypothetical protein
LDVRLSDHLKVGHATLVDEPEKDRLGRWRCPVLESQLEGLMLASADEIRGGIRPRMDITAASQCLPQIGSAPLAHVVDQRDSNTVSALKSAQISEKRRDVCTAVLVQPVQAHQGVEHQQYWLELCHGCLQALLVNIEVQSQARHSDDVEVNRIQEELPPSTECRETLPHLRKTILGEVDQGTTGMLNLETAEARRR